MLSVTAKAKAKEQKKAAARAVSVSDETMEVVREGRVGLHESLLSTVHYWGDSCTGYML